MLCIVGMGACDLGALDELIDWGGLSDLLNLDEELVDANNAPVSDTSFFSENVSEVQEMLWNELNSDNLQINASVPSLSARRLPDDQGVDYDLLVRQNGKKRFIRLGRVSVLTQPTLVTFLNVFLPGPPMLYPGKATMIIVASKRMQNGKRKVVGHMERDVRLHD